MKLGQVFVDSTFGYDRRMERRAWVVKAVASWQSWCAGRGDILSWRPAEEAASRWTVWRNIVRIAHAEQA